MDGQGVTNENLLWIMDRYPFVVNTENDLEHLIESRIPPKLGTKKDLETVGASIEDLINSQVSETAYHDLFVVLV